MASDIYIYNFSSEILNNLTNDLFSDSEPVWSPDGQYIAFVSDRSFFKKTNLKQQQPFESAKNIALNKSKTHHRN